MGQPGWSNVQSSANEYKGCGSDTQGSETSQYLKEEKSIEIPIVAASEMGLGRIVIIYLLAEHFGKSEQRG